MGEGQVAVKDADSSESGAEITSPSPPLASPPSPPLRSLPHRCKLEHEAAAASSFKLQSFSAPPPSAASTLRRRYELCRAGLQAPELQLRLFYGAPRKELEVRHVTCDVTATMHVTGM